MFDPIANLKEQRELAKRIIARSEGGGDPIDAAIALSIAGELLARLVLDLDQFWRPLYDK